MIRKDRKGRNLRTGEYQNADGRYRYSYIDVKGNKKDIYSWRLDRSDPYPRGKRKEPSLREKVKQIELDKLSGIVSDGGGYTVLSLVEKYVSLKTGVRFNTKAGYKTVINRLKADPFGSKRIDKVKLSDAKAWFVKLQKNDKVGYSTICSIRGILRPAFEMAVDDDLIRKNPFSFELSSVVINDSKQRVALTAEQEKAFLDFVCNDAHFSKYFEGIFILFKTGLRISEFCGLTIPDIDFENMKIRVCRQLQRPHQMKYFIEHPKTSSGDRFVPMSEEVALCFRKIIENRPKLQAEPVIDGCTGFLYLDKDQKPMVALHWEKYFKHIVQKYNSSHLLQMPTVTPHVCRHTFCSNMAKSGMNAKMLQYIMGHSDISITLNTYTHLGFDDAQSEYERITRLSKAE